MSIGPSRPLVLEKPAKIDIPQAARYFGARGEPDTATRTLLEKCAVPILAAATPPGRLAGSRCGQPAGSRDPAGRGCDEASGGLPAGTDAGSYSGPRRGCTDPPGRGGGYCRLRGVGRAGFRPGGAGGGRRRSRVAAVGRAGGKVPHGRFSPGYGDWPITVQPKVAAVLDTARRAGICVLNTNLMTPRKSVTAILGLSDHPVKGHLAGCGHCVLRTRCEYRKRGKTCASE